MRPMLREAKALGLTPAELEAMLKRGKDDGD
jgi:hypothetical protein